MLKADWDITTAASCQNTDGDTGDDSAGKKALASRPVAYTTDLRTGKAVPVGWETESGLELSEEGYRLLLERRK